MYADECKPNKSCPWIIIGVLVVPDALRDRALEQIHAPRDRLRYPREIHFQNLRNGSRALYGEKTGVALDWIRTVMHDRRGIWNLHIRAIHPHRLTYGFFGRDNPDDNIYTRFFRATLSYAVKSSVASGDYRIRKVFHDDTHLENHKYFPRSAIARLQFGDGVPFQDNEITFISSNHLKPHHQHPNDAEIIQVVDVCIGAFRQALCGASTHAGKNEVATATMPFFRMLNDPTHQCGPRTRKTCLFLHEGRSLRFYPKHAIRKQDDPMLRADLSRAFYMGESLAMEVSDDQISLF